MEYPKFQTVSGKFKYRIQKSQAPSHQLELNKINQGL